MLQMKIELMIIWKGYAPGFVDAEEVCIWIILKKKMKFNAKKNESEIFNFPSRDVIQVSRRIALFRKLAFCSVFNLRNA